MLIKNKIIKYVNKKYNLEPEYLWAKYPDFGIFRHKNNKKWFLVIMTVSKRNIGIESNDKVDIINVKQDPDIVLALSDKNGYCKGYHMNKKHWLTIILDGSVGDKDIFCAIDLSYQLTDIHKKK